MIKKVIKKIVAKFGYRLVPVAQTTPKNWFTMERALNRASHLISPINTVIDVGASDGRWSRECMRYFPDAQYLLVEAQRAHLDGLQAIKQEFTNVDFVMAVAGSEDGSAYFDDSDLFGGQASQLAVNKDQKQLPQISLDNEIKRKNLQAPFLLKLDTHGFEIPILEGAHVLIAQSSLLIIETYNFKLTDKSLRYWELCNYLDALGFSPIENVDLMLRKKDHVFWQMDIFFIRKDHQVFDYNKYE